MPNQIYLEIEGRRIVGIEEIEIYKSMTSLAHKFSLTTSSLRKVDKTIKTISDIIKVGQYARIFIDDNIIFTGFIHKLSSSFSKESFKFNVEGYSKTYLLTNSYIKLADYTSYNYVKMVEQVLYDNGFSDTISVITDQNINLASNKYSSRVDETIFSFLDRYITETGVLLLTNSDGNLLITKEASDESIGNLLSTTDNKNNNILDAKFDVDDTSVYRYIEARSSQSNDTFAGYISQSVKSPSFITATFEDKTVRYPTKLIVNLSSSKSTSQLLDHAKWQATLRRAKSKIYSCTVQGYYNDSASTSLWDINQLVKVVDDKNQIDGQFLIKDVSYRKHKKRGSTTSLTIVNKGSFSGDPSKQDTDIESNDFGTKWSVKNLYDIIPKSFAD